MAGDAEIWSLAVCAGDWEPRMFGDVWWYVQNQGAGRLKADA